MFSITATDFAAAAVVIDSIVTISVGRKLIKTAEKETAKAAETVTPVIKEHLSEAINTLLPLALKMLKERTEGREEDLQSGAILPLRSSSIQSE